MIFIQSGTGLHSLSGADIEGTPVSEDRHAVVLLVRRRAIRLYEGDFASCKQVLHRVADLIAAAPGGTGCHIIERRMYLPTFGLGSEPPPELSTRTQQSS